MSDIVAKVRNGTRSDADDICPSCRYCQITKGGRDSDEKRFCNELNKFLTGRVSFCNNYYNRTLPSMRDLYETAWILSTDKRTKAIGFAPYNKYKEREDAKLPDEFYD